MKTLIVYFFSCIAIVALLSSCSKSNSSSSSNGYPSGQGTFSGSGGVTFNLKGSAAVFAKKADTVYITGKIDSSQTINNKGFLIAIICKGTGNFDFNNFAANIFGSYTSGAVAFYTYETQSGSGSVTSHEFGSQSGSVSVTSFSPSQISGTYSVTLADANNNGDANITVTGNFTGNF